MNSSSVSSDDPLYVVIPISIFYSVIFVSGVIGNISTCIVIARNRHMHTATNYYLFSLAISDVLLLISGLPQEVYQLWAKSYVFGEFYCVLTGYLAETCANATVLTITAFTVERYVAICHPFLSHTVSKLSRAIKFILAIWLMALCLAIPQAIQFGLQDYPNQSSNSTIWVCTIRRDSTITYTFGISSCLFFVLPMTLITALYVLIGHKLGSSSLVKRPSEKQNINSQNRVIRMLIAVVVAFFICWAPFHGQRLLAVYAQQVGGGSQDSALITLYKAVTYTSGVLYYLSTTINPLLYNIMSHKFREAFKVSLGELCGRGDKLSQPWSAYSVLSRHNTQRSLGGCPAGSRTGGVTSLAGRLKASNSLNHPNHTISNSSLQDIEEEFTGSELAQVMGEMSGR